MCDNIIFFVKVCTYVYKNELNRYVSNLNNMYHCAY